VTSAGALEGRHAPGSAQSWSENWQFDFADVAGLGGYVRIALYPNQQRAWCWANLVVPGRDGPVIVRDHEVPLPRGAALAARSEGLWCELTCETPMEHWSIGVEAFGVALDTAADAYRGEIGERLAVGLDLEWEATTRGVAMEPSRFRSDAPYRQVGRVYGEVLLAAERFVFDGTGEREHSWGERDWWGSGWNRAAVCFDETLALSLFVADGGTTIGGSIWRAGEPTETVTQIGAAVEFDRDGIPRRGRYQVNEAEVVDFEVVGCAPVPLVAPDARVARFPRALCRFTTHENRVGMGWAEWLQPGAAAGSV
jgi:hypothetical protein